MAGRGRGRGQFPFPQQAEEESRRLAEQQADQFEDAPGAGGAGPAGQQQTPVRVRPPTAPQVEQEALPVPVAQPARRAPPRPAPIAVVAHPSFPGLDGVTELMRQVPFGRARGLALPINPTMETPVVFGRGRGFVPGMGRGIVRPAGPIGLEPREPVVGMDTNPPVTQDSRAEHVNKEITEPEEEEDRPLSHLSATSSCLTMKMSEGGFSGDSGSEAGVVTEASEVRVPAPKPASGGRTTLVRVEKSPASGPGSGSGHTTSGGSVLTTPGSTTFTTPGSSAFTTPGSSVSGRDNTSPLLEDVEVPDIVEPADAMPEPAPVEVVVPPVEPPAEPAAPLEQPAEEVPEKEEQPIKHLTGTKGKPVPIITNFLRLDLAEDKRLYEYLTTFSPELDSTKMRKRVLHDLGAVLGTTRTFDGQKLWLPYMLDPNQLDQETEHPNLAGQRIKISFRLVKKVATKDCAQFYNVLLRRIMSILEYTEMNRNYYDGKAVHAIEQHKLEVWPGYITAIEEYQGGLLLCLDSTHRVLRTTTVLEAMQVAAKTTRGTDWQSKYSDELIGKVVMTRYNGQTYKIDDIAWKASPTDTFLKRGVDITFVDYYLNQYGVAIQNKTQPLLLSKLKARKNDPLGKDVAVSLVPELCYITGLTPDLTSNFNVMRDIIAKARTSPKERIECIKRFVEAVHGNNEACQLLDAWGLKINAEPMGMNARNTAGPELIFNARYSVPAVKADFTREATSNKCFAPVALKNWVILCTAADKSKAGTMLTTYKQIAGPLGIAFGPDPTIHTLANGRNGTEWANLLRNVAIPGQTQFALIILPMAKDELYSAVKNRCIIESKIPSQVILAKTLTKERQIRSIMQKVALQINCKLGGSIWGLKIPMKELIMFVGVDTHHDPSRKKDSVLALVATMDMTCTSYYSRIVPTKGHEEAQNYVRPLFTQALATFMEKNHQMPNRVVVFRDGVGDGQMTEVTTNEITQLKGVADQMCPAGYNFTYVVVQKRINERLFLKKGPALDNPEPGTILDHTITRRGKYDFFLISQLVRQGTVSPTHYTVLEDCGEQKPDLVQRLSYVLSFMYFNWPGTIRVPAMCQYAHKLAMLTGQHLRNVPGPEMASFLYYL